MRASPLLVAALTVVMIVVALTWLLVDHRPPEWDHANHLERAILCGQDLARGDLTALLERSSFYPPLVLCAAGFAYRLVPTDAVTAQLVVLLFFGLGMAAVYLLARRIAGAEAGVVAALVFGTAPFVVFSLLRFQLDLPLAAMVALALYLLVRTEAFRHPWASLAAGVVLGLGMLTKPSFVVYVAPAFAWLLLTGRGSRRIVNALVAAASAALVSLPWYGPRLFGFPLQVSARSFAQAAESGHPSPLTWTALLWYPTWLPTQFGAVAVVLLVVGVLVALRRRQGFALVAVLVPFAAFLLIQNKNLRYTLPVLPAAAVLAALGYMALPRWLRATTAVAAVAAAILQVSATALGVPRLTYPGLNTAFVIESPPVRDEWRQREILDAVARDAGGRRVTVSVVPNHERFSVANFRYYGVRDGRPMAFERAWEGHPLGIDYMILKTGPVGPSWTEEKIRRVDTRLARDRELARVFPVVAEFPLPDGSTAMLRARREATVPGVTPAAMARAIEAAFRRQVRDVARDVEGLDVRLAYDDRILSGRLQRVEIEARVARIGELRRPDAATLRVRDFHVVLDDVLVNPFGAQGGRLDPLDVGRARLSRARIAAADLQEFLRGLKRFRGTTVTARGDRLHLVVEQPGPDLVADVRFAQAADRPFVLVADRVRVGGVPIPGLLVNWVIRHLDPAPRIARRLPMTLEIGAVTVGDDAIRISRLAP